MGSPILVFADDAESGAGNWAASGSWGIETVEGETFFSDSPGTVYGQRIDISLALDPVLDLSGAVNAVLRFRSRWEIEAEMDFGRIEVSADSGATWSALEATRTLPGHGMEGAFQFGTQPQGVPGYAGNPEVLGR